MHKKLLALLLSVTLIMGIFSICVHADDFVGGWFISVANPGGLDAAMSAEIVPGSGVSGNAMKMSYEYNEEGGAAGGLYLNMHRVIGGLKENTTYVLSFDYKRENVSWFSAYFNWDTAFGTTKKITIPGGTTADGDWEGTFVPSDPEELEYTTAAGATSLEISFILDRAQEQNGPAIAWLDNITLTEKDGNGKNLIANGDFENNVRNAMAIPRDGSIFLKWELPTDNSTMDESRFRVYQKKDDGTFELIVTNYRWEDYFFEGLVNGKTYTFKITATGDWGESEGVIITAAPGIKQPFKDWYVTFHNEDYDELYLVAAEYSLSSGEKAEGETSAGIHFSSYAFDDVYFLLYQDVEVEPNTTYTYSVKVKTENISSLYTQCDYEPLSNGEWENGTWDWDTITGSITTGAGQTVCQMQIYIGGAFESPAEGYAYIDDVVFRRAEGDQRNIIKNGGFEPEDIEVSEPQFFIDGGTDPIFSLEEGTLHIQFMVKNYFVEAPVSPTAVAALYDGGILKSIDADLSKTIAKGDSEVYDLYLEIPDVTAGDYSVKVMIWDGAENMLPIAYGDI